MPDLALRRPFPDNAIPAAAARTDGSRVSCCGPAAARQVRRGGARSAADHPAGPDSPPTTTRAHTGQRCAAKPPTPEDTPASVRA